MIKQSGAICGLLRNMIVLSAVLELHVDINRHLMLIPPLGGLREHVGRLGKPLPHSSFPPRTCALRDSSQPRVILDVISPGGSVIIIMSVRGERANFTGLVLGSIEAEFCMQILI